MFNVTDTEAYLLMQRDVDNNAATLQVNRANAEIRRLRLALQAAQSELKTEKAKRHAAEFAARRH